MQSQEPLHVNHCYQTMHPILTSLFRYQFLSDDPCEIGTPHHVAHSDDGPTELAGPHNIVADQQ